MLTKTDFNKLLNESPQDGGLNKADIEFAAKSYLKAAGKGEITEAIIKDFLNFVKDL